MVECQLPKLDVAGSTPVSRSIFSMPWKAPIQRPSPIESIYITSIIFSSSFTASRRRPKAAFVPASGRDSV